MISDSTDDHSNLLFEAQVGLVHLALDFAGNVIDDIFVYTSSEEGSFSYYAYYGCDGRIFTLEDIASVPGAIPRTEDEMWELLSEGSMYFANVVHKLHAAGVEPPTELRIHYSVTKNSLDSQISYNRKHSRSTTLTSADMFKTWLETIRAQYETA